MKRALYLIAAAAMVLMLASCDKTKKDPTPSKSGDIVGTWFFTQDPSEVYVFGKDGKFESFYDDASNETGTWKLKDGKLTITTDFASEYECHVIGGKGALALRQGSEFGTESFLLYKQETTIKSAPLTDGRWTFPHNGLRPASYDKANDYTLDLEIKGNIAKLVVHAWGMIIECPFTQENGFIKLEIAKNSVKQGGWYDSAANGWFWFMGGPPEGAEAGYDYSYSSMNAETYELQTPYTYVADDIMNQSDPFRSFYLVVDDNGKEAYVSAVGMTKWGFKR